jgi:aldehyde dehydrogenase (NAD+)
MINNKLLINGNLVDGHRSADVINPALGKAFATVGLASESQADAAVAAAKAAFPGWAATPLAQRQMAVSRYADAIRDNAKILASTLTQEQGKPLVEAAAEVKYTEIFLRYFAQSGFESELLQDDDDYRIEMIHKPLGPVVGITPWNLPLLIGANKIGPAVVTGNTVILKPAPTTPLTSLMLGTLAQNIFPPGVVNVITDANDLGERLSRHPDVAKITFTGSTATGKKVAQSAANSFKRLTLELGGNDAGIVLDDINVNAVAAKILGGSFMNAGQVCIALKRLYVPANKYDEMCDALAGLAEKTALGNGLDEGIKMGPLQNSMQFDKAKRYLDIASRDGRVMTGGKVREGSGYFVEPTIVRDISDGSALVDEEQFAPILPIIKYNKVDDVIKLANKSNYGLGGSVWSDDIEHAKSVAARIETGTVWINHHLHFSPNIPFCGAKESGIGVEFGREGLSEFTQPSVVSISKSLT